MRRRRPKGRRSSGRRSSGRAPTSALRELATRAGLALSAGALCGLLARDLAGLPPPAVAAAWLAGALGALAAGFGLGRT